MLLQTKHSFLLPNSHINSSLLSNCSFYSLSPLPTSTHPCLFLKFQIKVHYHHQINPQVRLNLTPMVLCISLFKHSACPIPSYLCCSTINSMSSSLHLLFICITESSLKPVKQQRKQMIIFSSILKNMFTHPPHNSATSLFSPQSHLRESLPSSWPLMNKFSPQLPRGSVLPRLAKSSRHSSILWPKFGPSFVHCVPLIIPQLWCSLRFYIPFLVDLIAPVVSVFFSICWSLPNFNPEASGAHKNIPLPGDSPERLRKLIM